MSFTIKTNNSIVSGEVEDGSVTDTKLDVLENVKIGYGGSEDGRLEANSGDLDVTNFSNINLNPTNNVQVGTSSDGTWNTTHIILGAYHIWVDDLGHPRIKNGAPTTHDDGTLMDTQ